MIPRSLVALALLVAPPVLAQAPVGFADPGRLTKLASGYGAVDSIFRGYAERQHIPGAVWAIVVDGKVAHMGMTGYRDVAAKAPVDSNSVFRIASMTKSFTAMAILKLRDEGKLRLDDPAERWVPELATLEYPTADAPKITIRHLLSHAGGFPEDNPWGDQQLAASEAEFSRMMRGGIPFSNAPGVAYEYSNYGFAILGRIVTRASGVPYRRYIQANILRPLGMTSTTLEPASVPASRLAQGYRWEDEQWKLEPQLPDGAFGAMGGMLTSLRDLAAYVGAYLAAWPSRDGPETSPVRRATLREMQQLQRPSASTVTRAADGTLRLASGGYGFGLRVAANCDFAHMVSHTGGLPGFGSIMQWLPEHGVGIIVFGNRTYSGWTAPTLEAFAALLRTGGLVPRMPVPSPTLVARRDAVTRLVLNWNEALADSLAANNLFLDRSRDRRKASIDTLLRQVGPCRPATGFDVVENALRGSWTLPCERGALRVAITLAPTMPPLVQYLDVAASPTAAPPPRRRACPD
jgi:CubicO group peptidase (beta-lactamase class C family)